MTVRLFSRIERVTTCLDGPGPVLLHAARLAGAASPVLLVEAYDGDALVTAGELAVWDLNQALAALLSRSGQARRLGLREHGCGRSGYVDVVTGQAGGDVSVFALAKEPGARAAYRAPAAGLAADLNAVLRHYLDMTRTTGRTIVLPDAADPAARDPRALRRA